MCHYHTALVQLICTYLHTYLRCVNTESCIHHQVHKVYTPTYTCTYMHVYMNSFSYSKLNCFYVYVHVPSILPGLYLHTSITYYIILCVLPIIKTISDH